MRTQVWYNAEKIPSRLVCGSHGAWLDCMLLKIQITSQLGLVSVYKLFMCYSEDSDSLL